MRSLSWCRASRARCFDGSIICSQSARTLFYRPQRSKRAVVSSSQTCHGGEIEDGGRNGILNVPRVRSLLVLQPLGDRSLLVRLLDVALDLGRKSTGRSRGSVRLSSHRREGTGRRDGPLEDTSLDRELPLCA